MSGKSQIAIEFVLVTGLAILIAITLLTPLNQLFGSASRQQADEALKDLGLTLQSELIVAASVKPGYSRFLTIPSHVAGFDYNISITQGFLSLTYVNGELAFPIPLTTGNFLKGKVNVIEKLGNGTLRVRPVQ